MRSCRVTLFLSMFVLAGALEAVASVLRVNAAAPPGGDGSSWSRAFAKLEDAIGSALGNPTVDQIWVAAGTYKPAAPGGDPNATFLWPKHVSFYGGFNGTETDVSQRNPSLNVTVLSGDLNSNDLPGFQHYDDNSLHLVTVMNGLGSDELFDGFTVAAAAFGGLYNQFGRVRAEHCAFTKCRWGGVYAEDASMTIASCTFSQNDLVAIMQIYGTFHVEQSVFEDNTGWHAITVNTGDLIVSDCRFARNEGAISLTGSAYYEDPSGGASLVMTRTMLEAQSDSTIEAHGGETKVLVDVRDCEFVGSVASTGAAFDLTAGEKNGDVTATITDCRLQGSLATFGGAFFLSPGESESSVDVQVLRSSFANGHASQGGVVWAQGAGGGASVRFTADRCAFLTNGADRGGVLFASAPYDDLQCDFVNCLMVDNTGSQIDVQQRHAKVTLTACTVAAPGNTDHAIAASDYAAVEVRRSILWGEATVMIDLSRFASAFVAYSCVKGGYSGAGNIALDPLFASYASGPAGDFRLTNASPCVDAGLPGSKPKGRDYFGNPRFLDGDLDGALVTDMGAHELDQVQLAISGSATPGGTLTFATTGQAGLAVMMLIGLAEQETLLPGFGNLFVSLGSLWRSYSWGTVPSSVPAVIPPDVTPGLAIIVQEAALGGAGKTLSNPVTIVIQ